MTVEDLLHGLRNGNIEAYCGLNCNELIISSKNKSRFIESVIVGIPLLPLVFNGSRAPWYIIDGVKRLSIILGFANNEFQLRETYYSRLPEYTYFEEMNPFLRNRFLKAPVPCYIMNPGTPPDIIDDIRYRIKTKL